MKRLAPLMVLSISTFGICGVSGISGCRLHAQRDDKPATAVTPGEVVIPVAQQAGLIQSEVAQTSHVPDVIRVPGVVALPDNGKWRVGAITSGRIEKVFVSLGDYVHADQVLARTHSHDVHEARAAYETAVADRARDQSAETVTRKNYQRTQNLYDMKAASLEQVELARQQWVDSQTSAQSSDIAVQREKAHLEDNLGISISELTARSGEDADSIPVRAPASGYVLQKSITPGTVVDLATDLFVIGELQHLWLTASVRQEYLETLNKGQPATIFVNGLPEVKVAGHITNLGQQFDPTTHTMQVRIEFENPNARLRPEMLATAELPVGREKPAIFVPAEAVQQINGRDSVFVQTSADRFVARSVTTSSQVGEQVPIEGGVRPGEHVVTRGAFILKSELLKASIQSD
jgi:membrane fusion protein, heavy metal efflux system